MTIIRMESIATVNADGVPSIRTVLLKDISNDGLTFYTNYDSRKGLELAENSKIAVNFYWDKTFKQIKILGTTEKVPRETSEAYWKTRPRESQISQWVSKQSQPVSSLVELNDLYTNAELELSNKEIPCPKNWGGYLIKPYEIEFWTGKAHRFHDRFKFLKKESSNWLGQRLFP